MTELPVQSRSLARWLPTGAYVGSKLATVLAAFLCVSSPALGANAATLKELAEVQKIATARTGFSVKFEQQTYSAKLKRTKTQAGTLEFNRAEKFRWEVTSPEKELYVSDGSQLWIYNEKRRNARSLPLANSDIPAINLFLKLESVKEHYEIEEWAGPLDGSSKEPVLSANPPPSGDSRLLLKLLPKDKSAPQKAIYLSIDKKSGSIEEMRLVNRNENRVRVTFSEFKPTSVSQERFQFVPPPGTHVTKN